MPLLTEAEVLARATRTTTLKKSTALESLTETAAADATFDVFLSHSSNEPENILLGIKGYLEDSGLGVYVDRYTDPQLSPEEVTPETAETLRGRLRASTSLLYVYSRHSKLSRWMPWELGFMDGAGRRIGIAPVVETARSSFAGEQYLGLYPYLDRATIEVARLLGAVDQPRRSGIRQLLRVGSGQRDDHQACGLSNAPSGRRPEPSRNLHCA